MYAFHTHRARAGTDPGIPVQASPLNRVGLLALAITALAVLLLATTAPAALADAEEVDKIAPPAKWLDFFCIGSEQCAVGDFDGDGRDDIATFVRDTRFGVEQGDVYVALSTGAGFAAPAKWADFFCTGQDVCKVGDVNGDGRDDLVSFAHVTSGANAGDVLVTLSTGTGFGPLAKWNDFFCLDPEVCDVGDFNGDNRDDIVLFKRSAYTGAAIGDVVVALSNGFNAFVSPPQPLWHDFFCIGGETCGVGDFNGDNRDDIIAFAKSAAGSQVGSVFVALSTGNNFGTGNKWQPFFCVGNETCGVGDFNGDNRDDIVTFLGGGYDALTQGDVYVALSKGEGFTDGAKWNDQFCLAYQVCGVGDFDGDGRQDVITFVRDTVLGDGRGDVYVALALGGASVFVSDPNKWSDYFCLGSEECATGDFNGDGITDVLSFVRNTQAGAGQGDVLVALSTGRAFGTSARWADFFCAGANSICKVGDVDGDGKDDVIEFTRGTSGQVLVARSTGNSFAAPAIWSNYFCLGNEICDVGDFDGDRRADAVSFTRSAYGGAATGDVYVGLSNGYSFANGAKWNDFFCILSEQCGVGDFNGDGRDDIVSFSQGSAADVFVGLSNGYAFTNGTKWHDFFCAGTEVCGVGDFNGDGKEDVVTFLRNGYDAATAGDVFVGESTGSSFASLLKWNDFFCIGNETCATGDFNGDGFTDIGTFLRNTQGGAQAGDVLVALANGSGYRFGYITHITYLPALRR